VLRPTLPAPLLGRAALARVLATATMDTLMRCTSGSVAVSAYELEFLPLPAAQTLHCWEPLTGASLNTAIAAAYRPSR
jgi:adenine-specific DNA-methyltransferase